jgi:SAM-dependent methyltransferase
MIGMDELRDVAARFDRVAATYDQIGVHAWLAMHVAEFAAPIDARRILDVATGTGQVIEAMIAGGSRADFTGVDISAGMLAEAAAKPLAARTDLQVMDGSRLSFADNTFDLTVCVSAMAYFADPVAALAEWSRVTRQGRIVVSAWAQDGLTLPRLVRQAAGEAGVDLPARSAAMGSPRRIEETAARAGLAVSRLVAVEHHDELKPADAAAWDRVIVGEHGAAMRAADDTVRARARDRFTDLLTAAIRAGAPNSARAHIFELRAAAADV